MDKFLLTFRLDQYEYLTTDSFLINAEDYEAALKIARRMENNYMTLISIEDSAYNRNHNFKNLTNDNSL